MSINVFKKIALLGCIAASASAMAGPLNDYNLILSNDLNVSGGSGHIEGKAFIGGDVINGSIYAQKLNRSSTDVLTKVVGNFASNNGTHVEAGYLAYQGNFTGPTNICNSNAPGLSGSGCIKKVTDNSLTAEKASILDELKSESDYYKSLATSADFVKSGDNNNSIFTYSGVATDLAVFNITAADLTGPQWNIDFGLAVNVLINVSGSVFNAGNTKNGTSGFTNNANNVLWNFFDATSLNFGDSWYGSVLALNADIRTGSNLNGAIAAKSYLGNGEIHQGHWSYTPPQPPPIKVPEPSSLLLSLLGLGLILLGRARRK
uniref:PEP-CTERM putative exosortase interaction domain protein n=1 Tax=uncultured organism TaxID=155900 RepID=D8VN46_9ZZZZ|nr:PEP-CTERM putative exosortase interaction domain protein [uncultured organism]